MSTLIIVEHDNETINPSIRQVLTAALSFGQKITLLVIGYQCHQVAKLAASLPDVHSVFCVDAPAYEHPLAENISIIVKEMAGEFAQVLAASTTFGKNLLPRVAALLNVGQVSDVSKILANDTFEHPIYAGNAIEVVRVLDAIKVLTIRAIAFDAHLGAQSPCQIEHIEPVFSVSNTQFITHSLNESTRPELSHAKIIVAGGRGLQSKEKFQLIDDLADALGGAVGASRAAVDAGFVSNDYQVGQTGKVVAPMLYIAVGISGAIQHLAGMKDSKVIVAINKDADAPIFQIANYGLVGDLFTLLPEFIAQLNKNNME